MTPDQAQALGRVEQKINDMCVTNTKEHREIRDIIDTMQTSKELRELASDKKFEARPTNKVFYWIMTGVFGMLFFIFGMMVNLDNKIDIHIDHSEDAYYQITGKVYTPSDKGHYKRIE